MVAAALLTAALLCDATDAPRRTAPKLKVSVSWGSFVSTAWVAQSYRDNVYRFRDEAVDDLNNHGSVFDSNYLLYTAPVLGPWMTIARGGQQAREDVWLLLTSGCLQAIGLSALTYRLFTQRVAPVQKVVQEDDGLELSFSPYVSGRLGLAVTLTGF